MKGRRLASPESRPATSTVGSERERSQWISAGQTPGIYLGHRAPDLRALYIGNVSGAREVQPVGLIQLGPDQEVEVRNALVLPDQRGRQPQLAVRLHNADHLQHREATINDCLHGRGSKGQPWS